MSQYPKAGDRFGPYLIVREVGHGGMGVVFAAQQSPLNRTVALKVLNPRLANDADFAARFQREAALLMQADSPHVIKVLDHGRVGECLYLAMQWVAGGDLASYLKQHGQLPIHLAAELSAQVGSALADAHACGVIHRDVKPSNVLLATTGSSLFAYLCDFGIAQSEPSGLTQAGAVAGSMAFTAPERFEGRTATERSDLYSLGCLFWALITGRNPYSGTDFQIAKQHLDAPIPQIAANSAVEVRVNRILQALLAKDPLARPASAVQVVEEFHQLQRLALQPTEPDVDRTQLRTDAVLTVPASSSLPPTRVAATSGQLPAVIAPAGELGALPEASGTRRRILIAAGLAALVVGGGGVWWASSRQAPAAVAGSPASGSSLATGTAGASVVTTRESASRLASTIYLEFDHPHGIALDEARGRLFVAGFEAAAVAVVNVRTADVVDELAVGSQPQQIVIDERSGLLLVACGGSSTVEFFDLASLAKRGTIATAGGALRLTLDSNLGVAYVLAQESSSIQVIDLSTRAQKGEVFVGGQPRALALDVESGAGYVVDWADGSLSAVDLATGDAVQRITVGTDPIDVKLAPAYRLALVANQGSHSVSVVDLDTKAVKETVPIGEHPSRIAVDEAAGAAYVSCLGDGVNVIDLRTLQMIRVLPAGPRPTGLALDSSSGELYVTNFKADFVQVFAS